LRRRTAFHPTAPIIGEIHFGDLGLGWIRVEFDPNANRGVLDLPAEGLLPLAAKFQEIALTFTRPR
jgi:hypothetical protein